MHHAPVFALLSGICAWQALTVFPSVSAVPLALAALTLGALALTFGYPRCASWWKGRDGRIPPWTWALFWPYFVLSWFTFFLFQLAGRERALDEIVPGIYLGRRLFPWERGLLPTLAGVLDLTWEFGEVAFLRSEGAYRCIPLPDGGAPTLQQLELGADWIAEHLGRGNVYVHCALGHGRSATFVAAYLIASRRVEGAQSAIHLLRTARPGVGLSPSQRQVLEAFTKSRP